MQYIDFLDLCEKRYSCRNYSTEPVNEEKVMKVLRTAQLAPSACNRQPWMFIIADTPDERAAVIESYPREWIKTAPEFIIACGNHEEAWHRPHDGKAHTDIDVAIAVEHMCLAAATLDLATCWVCHFDPAIIRKAFNLPAHIEPIAIIPIGHPAEGVKVPVKNRKSLADIMRRGKF